MHYLASNFAHINRIVISTATSIFILVTWVFPSLKKNPKPTSKSTIHKNENSQV